MNKIIFEFEVLQFTSLQFTGIMNYLYMLGNMFIVFVLVFETSITTITKMTEFWSILFLRLEKIPNHTHKLNQDKIGIIYSKQTEMDITMHALINYNKLNDSIKNKHIKAKLLCFSSGFGHGFASHTDIHEDDYL